MADEASETTETTEAAEPSVTEDAAPSIAERPDFLPEKFWNKDTGEVRLEDMAKSYAKVEKEVSGRITQLAEDRKQDIDDAARAALKLEMNEEVEAARLSERPESSTEYDIGELPDVFDKDVVDAGSLATWWRDFAYNQGLNQEQFKQGMDAYVDYISADLPDPTTEMAALGDNARARTDAVEMWSSRFFKDDMELAEIQALGSTAAGVRALERVMEAAKGTSPSAEGEGEHMMDDKISIETAKEMMADPKYWDSARRDPDWVARVNSAFQ